MCPMKNSSIYEMLKAIAAEFGTDGAVVFNRPLTIKKTPRDLPEVVSFVGYGVLDDMFFDKLLYVTCETTSGAFRVDLPIDSFSFTDRLRILRRAVRFTEKIVRDK